MNGWPRICCLFGMVFILLSGCGSSPLPPAQDDTSSLASAGNRFVDWDALDWKFTYPGQPMSYLRPDLDADSAYQELTKYKGHLEPLDLAAFRALPSATQDQRRLAAEKSLYDGMAFYRVMLLSLDVWCQTLNSQIVKEVWKYGSGIITPAIQNLETAVGLDPSNPFSWQHLAFFVGLVGNTPRQLQALNAGFAALDDLENRHQDLSPAKITELNLMRLRMLLEMSWLLRDRGDFEDAKTDVDLVLSLIGRDELQTLDLAREALLLQALLMVDQGFVYEAQAKANEFDTWRLPYRSIGSSPVMTKQNYPHYDSDFCRQWVWDLSHLKLGNDLRATRTLGEKTMNTEFPAHLGYRYWQDMGRIREHFQNWEMAGLCYAYSLLTRPFLTFYPLVGTASFSTIFGQENTGNPYFLGYKKFFVAGSYFSFAASWVLATDEATDPVVQARYGQTALEALAVCRKRDIRPISALALQGKVHYTLGFPDLAERDLVQVDQLLKAEGTENAEVIKQLAVIHFEQKNYAASGDDLARYVRLKPDDPFGWQLSGLALAHLERYQDALNNLDTARALDPQSLPGWYNSALVRLKLGQVDQARADLQQAQNVAPENEDVARLAALIRTDPEATVTFTSDIDSPSPTPETRAKRRVNFGEMGLTEDDQNNLLQSLRTEFAENPTEDRRLGLAQSLAQAGRMTEVQEILVTLWPNNISTEEIWILLQADRALGQPERAIDLARTLTTDDDPVADAEIWALVAVTCLESGAEEGGQLALAWALKLDPENRALMMMQASQSN